MHFEPRRYAAGAFNLLVEVWDSSASALMVSLVACGDSDKVGVSFNRSSISLKQLSNGFCAFSQ